MIDDAPDETAEFETVVISSSDPPDFHALIEILDEETPDLARGVHEIFVRAVPSAARWPESQRSLFSTQAKGRLSAVLAVMEAGADIDMALREDLEDVGAHAALSGASLPHLLLVLHATRDVLIERVVELAIRHGERWEAVTRSFVSRTPKTVDRLADAVTHGYWTALSACDRASLQRLEGLMEHTPYGIYEADVDGVIRYANPALASIVRRNEDCLEGSSLAEAFSFLGNDVSSLFAEPVGDVDHLEFAVPRSGELPIHIEIDTVVRRADPDAQPIGFGGIVRVVS